MEACSEEELEIVREHYEGLSEKTRKRVWPTFEK
jgi:hypothetical protein